MGKGLFNNIFQYILLSHSRLFDRAYYLKTYPDVRKADVDPLWHFIRSGLQEGRYPAKLFATTEFHRQDLSNQKLNINTLEQFIITRDKEVKTNDYRDNNLQEILISDGFFIEGEDRLWNKIRHNNSNNKNQKGLTLLVIKFIRSIKEKGVKKTFQKIKRVFSTENNLQKKIGNRVNSRKISEQRNFIFDRQILFSILVPLYRTPLDFLDELIKSVIDQTYPFWELCLVDGSDEDYELIENTIPALISDNPQIKYRRLTGNRGIAGNTIEAYNMANGDYIVLLDHDDILTKDALFELMRVIDEDPEIDIIYSDRAIFSNETRKILAYHYLPGFNPDYLRSMNYMSHLIAYSDDIIKRAGFEREGYDGSQDYELLLRCAEKTKNIQHIPKVLYLCRASEGSVAHNPQSKMYAYEAGKKAISEHIQRIGYPGEVKFLPELFAYKIDYNIQNPKVSIVILNKDHVADLRRCIDSILNLSTYKNYEVVIVENNSTEEKTFQYYESLINNPKINVIFSEKEGFNFSSLNNFAVKNVNGEYILLLNNDTEVISPSWIEEMLMFTQRDDVGAVGAKLLYPDNTIQHCGLVIGLEGNIANNYGHKKPDIEKGYMHSLVLPQNYSAVTAACLMIKRQDYINAGGMDEIHFPVGLNDVDLCLKLREMGFVNVWTPYSKLYHYEGISRGSDASGKNKIRYDKECVYFREKWQKYFINGDPFDRVNFKGW